MSMGFKITIGHRPSRKRLPTQLPSGRASKMRLLKPSRRDGERLEHHRKDAAWRMYELHLGLEAIRLHGGGELNAIIEKHLTGQSVHVVGVHGQDSERVRGLVRGTVLLPNGEQHADP